MGAHCHQHRISKPSKEFKSSNEPEFKQSKTTQKFPKSVQHLKPIKMKKTATNRLSFDEDSVRKSPSSKIPSAALWLSTHRKWIVPRKVWPKTLMADPVNESIIPTMQSVQERQWDSPKSAIRHLERMMPSSHDAASQKHPHFTRDVRDSLTTAHVHDWRL